MTTPRLLLVASAGGHWVQLSRLAAAFEGFDAQYVTTLKGARAPCGERSVAVVRDGSQTDPVGLLVMFAQLFFIVLKFRPSTIVTTGAAPGVFAVRLGKLLGARTVWIDSIANSEKLSLSGRLVRKHVDLCLTQWPHLTDAYPDVQCFGSVI